MTKILKLSQSFVHRTLILASVAIVHGCGEVKVVDSESTLAKVDPLNEVVVLDTSDGSPETLECLKIEEVVSTPEVVLSETDQKVFENALKAHLAPLNYPIAKNCENSVQITVREYRVRDLVVASRLAIQLSGTIFNSSKTQVWSASYRLTENAGSIPLDPISAGFGIASAAQNSSQDAKHNGVYLSVRRLLRALPEHAGLAIPVFTSELPKTNTEKVSEQLDTQSTYYRLFPNAVDTQAQAQRNLDIPSSNAEKEYQLEVTLPKGFSMSSEYLILLSFKQSQSDVPESISESGFNNWLQTKPRELWKQDRISYRIIGE